MTAYKKGILFAVITAFSWSILAIALKYALNFGTAATIAWFRMLIATVVLFGIFYFRFREQLHILRALPLLGLLAGVGLGLNYFGYMKGIALTSASHAQIMIQMAPMSLVLVGIFYFREIPSSKQLLGLCVAVLGFILFYWDQWAQNINAPESFLWGNFWIVIAALSWTFFASFQKVLSKKWNPQQINLLIYLVASLVLFPWANTAELSTWSPGIWILMLACGLNTLVAYGCLGEAFKRIPASHVSLIISINPLFTLLFIWILTELQVSWLKPEPVQLKGYIGAVFVVFGVILTLQRPQPKSNLKA